MLRHRDFVSDPAFKIKSFAKIKVPTIQLLRVYNCFVNQFSFKEFIFSQHAFTQRCLHCRHWYSSPVPRCWKSLTILPRCWWSREVLPFTTRVSLQTTICEPIFTETILSSRLPKQQGPLQPQIYSTVVRQSRGQT